MRTSKWQLCSIYTHGSNHADNECALERHHLLHLVKTEYHPEPGCPVSDYLNIIGFVSECLLIASIRPTLSTYFWLVESSELWTNFVSVDENQLMVFYFEEERKITLHIQEGKLWQSTVRRHWIMATKHNCYLIFLLSLAHTCVYMCSKVWLVTSSWFYDKGKNCILFVR